MAIDAGERHPVTLPVAGRPRLPTTLAGTALIAGVAYRLLLLLTDTPPTNSDEATMGLAALHIGQGQEFPIWFYGQAYMGTLEAYLAAPLVALTGPSTLALRLPTLALYAVFALLAWRLTLRLTGDHWYALLVTVLLAYGSDRIVKNQLIAGGGYPEMNAAGVALALLAYDLAAGRQGYRAARWTGWGLLAGLMAWVDPLVLPYVVGTGAVLLAFRWRELWGRAGALLGVGALVGATPLLLDSFLTGRSPLTAVLAASGAGESTSWAERLHGGLVLGPALGMGFCSPSACARWQLWWSVALPLLLLATAVIAWRQLRGYRRSASARNGPPRFTDATAAAISLALVAAAAVTLASFATSSAAGRSPVESSRYLSCLLISVPVLLWPAWNAARRRSPGLPDPARAAAIGVLAGTLGTAAIATGATIAAVPAYRTVQAQHAELVATLRVLEVRHVYSDYWTCNRLTFASAEEIVCAVVNDDLSPGHDRYPAYRRAVAAAASPTWVAPAGSPLAARLQEQVRGGALTLRHIPGWHVFLSRK
ncbi:hypothetical protein [Salinispora oceanensis]|uniref:hypothetical protein n=1 Tax=Salinispora oceanensis TaxID=1050199 RepID=UPI0003804DDC|nr:hypothetical protein [Salinispora oceanensis]